MKIRISDIRLDIDHDSRDLRKTAARCLQLPPASIQIQRIIRKAVDARRSRVQFCYTVEAEVDDALLCPENVLSLKNVSAVASNSVPELTPLPGVEGLKPVIVGTGPAGLFCALKLLQFGIKPIILERGQPVEQRVAAVEKFWSGGPFDPSSNVQFGEGGAGTFSDGKLTTRIDDPRVEEVLQTFVRYGASPEILYLKKPHIGTDQIRRIVVTMRDSILEQGGEIYFNSCLTDINIVDGRLLGITINREFEMACQLLILATGNSARDLYRLLDKRGVRLVAKSFAIGVRIEHLQTSIDTMQYGKYAGHPALEAADYNFTYKDPRSERSAYTFCMCPGGFVIASNSDSNQVVTNGMSMADRKNKLGNSAIVAAVQPKDWGHAVLGGLVMQEDLERRAYLMGGGGYLAPAQRVDDFLEGRGSDVRLHGMTSYRPGVVGADLRQLFSEDIAKTIQNGILYWGRKAPEFLHRDAVLTAVETRTSAPVRIMRDENRRCEGIENIYPCGEGSGYAGGIVSSAIDGIKTAERIIGG